MTKFYQPKLEDLNCRLRRQVVAIQKKTGISKNMIVKRVLAYGLERYGEIFTMESSK